MRTCVHALAGSCVADDCGMFRVMSWILDLSVFCSNVERLGQDLQIVNEKLISTRQEKEEHSRAAQTASLEAKNLS